MRSASRLAPIFFALLFSTSAFAGGPLYVAGTAFPQAVQGKPLVWDTSSPVPYRTPSSGALGKMNNAAATARVQKLFQIWQDVPTAKISYQNAGPILATGKYSGGPVDSAAKFDAVYNSCKNGTQSPIIFDAAGGLMAALGIDPGVIGFAGLCAADVNAHLRAALVALNGAWIDGNQANGELSDNQFDEAFTHEFGHFSGLDHSQINVSVLLQSQDHCDSALMPALPVMFPFAQCQARVDAGLPPLSPDDEAWISLLYPETANNPAANQVPFNSVYGVISGKVLFHDGQTPVQGVNLTAESDSQPGAMQFSVVSGYLFSGDPGQSVSGDNPGDDGLGAHDPALIGTYEIPVKAGSYSVFADSISLFFSGGSSVGPLSPPIPVPTGGADPKRAISVAAGAHVTGIDFQTLDNFDRFDQFEPQ
jgi:hypothetical protein